MSNMDKNRTLVMLQLHNYVISEIRNLSMKKRTCFSVCLGFFFTHDDTFDFIQFLCICILRLTCVSFNNISVNRLKFPFFSFEKQKQNKQKQNTSPIEVAHQDVSYVSFFHFEFKAFQQYIKFYTFWTLQTKKEIIPFCSAYIFFK